MIKKLRLAFLPLVVSIGGYYVFRNFDDIKVLLSNVTMYGLFLSSLVIICSYCIVALKFKQLFAGYNIYLKPLEWWGLPQIRRLFNLLFFKSGTVTAAYYLKSNYNLSYSRFIIIQGSEKIIDLFTFSTIGFILSCSILGFSDRGKLVVSLFGIFIISLYYFLFVSSISLKESDNWFMSRMRKGFDIWNEFKSNTSAIKKIVLVETVQVLTKAGRYFVSFYILNSRIDYVECIVIALVIFFVGFVTLLPGNIGVNEAIVGTIAIFFNHDFDGGVVATTLDRVIGIFWAALSGALFFNRLQINMVKKEFEENGESA